MKTSTPEVSVVIPIYRNEVFIDELVARLKDNLGMINTNFEIVLVNDGSPDNSWDLIQKHSDAEPRIIGVCLARNFGQHMAITAGLDYCTGDWVVVMDGDLQDKPEEISKLHRKALEGYDVVFARRFKRKDGFFKKILSRIFYKVFDYFVGGSTDHTVANFGIYSRKVIDNFKRMREHSRLFPLFIHWLGFEAAYVDVEHGERSEGKSAYTFFKRLNLAADTIISMSNNPLKISVKLGFVLSLASFLAGLIMIGKYLMWGIPVQGWTSLIVTIFFVGGLLFTICGVLGLYIGKIFDEVKGRPLYVIDRVLNSPDETFK